MSKRKMNIIAFIASFFVSGVVVLILEDRNIQRRKEFWRTQDLKQSHYRRDNLAS